MKREFLAAFKKLEKAADGRYCELSININSISKTLKYMAYIELPGPYAVFGGNRERIYDPMEAVDLCIERYHKKLAELDSIGEEKK